MADEDLSVEEHADGSATVTEPERPERKSTHFENLVEVLPPSFLAEMASELKELINIDKESLGKRDKQYAEGLERTGFGVNAPGGASFQGASKVTHPLLGEATVDFTARVMRELLSGDGPVRAAPKKGELKAEVLDRADRKAERLNQLFLEEIPEFRDELWQTVSQEPLGGSQYMGFWKDSKKIRCEFYPVDQVFLPYAASSYRTAERRTHADMVTREQYRQRVTQGMYVAAAGVSPQQQERTKAQAVADRAQGQEPDFYNKDGLRIVYRVDVIWQMPEDKEPRPYLVHLDEPTSDIVGLFRNWREDDKEHRRIERVVEFPFFRWRGAYGIGLIHMIGSLSAASTGALRALLDSAHINNSQTALKLKGGTTRGGQSVTLRQSQVHEVDAKAGVDDIRKAYMPLPFNPPSPVLFELLGFLVDSGRGMVRTTLEEVGETNANVPVGTTLARIDEGTVVFGSIYGLQVQAMGECIKIACDILAELGESEFEDATDVAPAADPRVFSDTKRMNQITALQQRDLALKGTGQNIYDTMAIEKRFARVMGVPDADELFVSQPKPTRMNAVNENAAMMLGRPVAAYPDQDHEAHIQTMLSLAASPLFWQLRVLFPAFVQGFLGHLKEHLALWYVTEVYETASNAAGRALEKLFDSDPAVERELDAVLAVASGRAVSGIEQTQVAQVLPPIVQQAVQFLQSMAPPPPQSDPALMAEVKRKTARDQQDKEADAAEGQRKTQEAQMKNAVAIQQTQSRERIAAHQAETQLAKQRMADQTKIETNDADNQTARDVTAAKVAEGLHSNITTGTGINPNPE